MRSPLFSTALAMALLVLLASPLAAFDSVFLRTGELFTGKVLRVDGKEVSIQLESGGILSFRRSQVSRVRRWLPGKPLPEVIDFDQDETPVKPIPPVSNPPIVQPSDPPRSEPPPVVDELKPSVSEPQELPNVDVAVEVEVEPKVTAVASSKQGWAFTPPTTFEPALKSSSPELVEFWVEPITQATLTLAAYPDGTSVQEVKQMILREMPGTLPPQIYRDLPLNRKGEGGFEGWILEVKQELADTSIQQLNLFATHGPVTFILRCTAPANSYQLVSNEFEKSLHTLRIYDEKPSEAESGDEKESSL